MDHIYDLAIIGAGMFGSSCARWASEDVESSILIGPSENAKTSSKIFGAWFDEGRITEMADSTTIWRTLAKHSIGRYREIEEKSGLDIFSEVGFLNVLSKSGSDPEHLKEYAQVARLVVEEGFDCEQVDESYAKTNFPFLNLPPDFVAYHQPNCSGHLNPRSMVAAQKIIASQNGCVTLDGNVTNISRYVITDDQSVTNKTDNSEKVFKIEVNSTDGSGEIVAFARKLILAPGAYVNLNPWFRDCIPDDIKNLEPDLTLFRQTVAFLEVSADEAFRLRKMPNIVTHFKFGPLDGTYVLPPILYPDGKFYLKVGHLDQFETMIPNDESALNELTTWYQSGSGYSEALETLKDFITKNFIPDIRVKSIHGGSCVTAQTPDMNGPYIDHVADDIVLVAGGNGYGANCCDEIGRIGAKLSTRNKWTSELPKEGMAIQWRKCISDSKV